MEGSEKRTHVAAPSGEESTPNASLRARIKALRAERAQREQDDDASEAQLHQQYNAHVTTIMSQCPLQFPADMTAFVAAFEPFAAVMFADPDAARFTFWERHHVNRDRRTLRRMYDTMLPHWRELREWLDADDDSYADGRLRARPSRTHHVQFLKTSHVCNLLHEALAQWNYTYTDFPLRELGSLEDCTYRWGVVQDTNQ